MVNSNNIAGDLIITFNIIFPKILSEIEKKNIHHAFSPIFNKIIPFKLNSKKNIIEEPPVQYLWTQNTK